eukprot:TRINITY_DN50172_c0_g1_i1.p1 TRINITY_DN50172_c0_g1~~TRINITY_DN50172_c0_g1_i1.p1  ORF type:complete len:465 (+),score=125.45 TRINITY_DN50172_c0_g1_i1:191-1585(+)
MWHMLCSCPTTEDDSKHEADCSTTAVADDSGNAPYPVQKLRAFGLGEELQSDVAPHIWIPIEVEPLNRMKLLQKGGCLDQGPLTELGRWHLNAFEFAAVPEVADRPLAAMTQALFGDGRLIRRMPQSGLLGSLPLGMPTEGNADLMQWRIFRFVEKIESGYLNVPYHNSIHASDVMATMEFFLSSRMIQSFCGTLDHVVCLMAAACHDVGHTGLNNGFQVATSSGLAIRYNDRSPLEQMHAALAFEIMHFDEECNWISVLKKNYQRGKDTVAVNLQSSVKKMITSMILNTDNSLHGELVNKWDTFLRVNHMKGTKDQARVDMVEMPCLTRPDQAEQKQLVLDMVFHLADVSNACKPLPIAMKWTKCLLEEVWLQGDEEAKLGLPISPLCDRSSGSGSVPAGQAGFISFFIAPAWESLVLFIPEAVEGDKHMRKNLEFWKDKEKEGASFADLYPTVAPSQDLRQQ